MHYYSGWHFNKIFKLQKMNIKFLSQTFFQMLLLVPIVLSTNQLCFPQNKFDLEIKVEPASETARGGEKFSYAV